MTNKRGAILGTLLLFIVVPKCAHAMNAELNSSDVLRKKIINLYTILNEARSQESKIIFLKKRPKELKFDRLRDLLSSIKKYRKLTGENERFSFLEKVIAQEMQEVARYVAKKDNPSENFNVSFEQEWENEKR